MRSTVSAPAPHPPRRRRQPPCSCPAACARVLLAAAGAWAAVVAAPPARAADPVLPEQTPAPAVAPAEGTAPVYETVVRPPPPDPTVPREDLTASASVITPERTPRGGETLPQLLAEQPGLSVTRYGSYGSLATLSVRGSPASQVAVYVDGVPLSGALVGTVDLGLIPPTQVQRIEIYRGSSPLGFGSSAMGGIVSITSEEPARSGVGVESGAGSFATRHAGASAAWRGARGSVTGRLQLFRSRADFPYHNDNGTVFDPSDDRTVRRENNDLDQLDGSVRGQLDLPAGRRLVLSLSALGREQGLPARGIYRSLSARLDRRRLAASASLSSTAAGDHQGGALGPSGRWKVTLYGLGSEQRFDDPLGEIAFVPTATRDRALTLGAITTASRALGVRGPVLAGMLDLRHEAYRPRDRARTAQRLPGTRSLGAAGLSATQAIAPWRLELVASLRGEAARDEVSPEGDLLGRPATASAADWHFLPLGRVGLAQSPGPGLRLRANVGRYARLPTLFERYGNAGTILGNARLRPEQGFNADLGARWELGPGAAGPLELVVDGAVFHSRSSDLIHFEQKGYFAGFENVARARTRGAELSLDARAFSVLHLFCKATALDARDASGSATHDGRRLPQLPVWRGYLRPELRDLPLGAGLALGLYGDLELAGRRFQDRANQVPQAGRAVLGAGASLALRAPAASARPEVRLVASGYNLGEATAPDVLDYPIPGRSFFLTLALAYSAKEPSP